MKKLLFIALTFIAISLQAQDFMGVEVNGPMPEILQKFKEKGYTLVTSKEDMMEFSGKLGSDDIQLFTFFTPLTKACWKFVIYLPKKYTWASLRDEYREYKAVLTQKYGLPRDSFETFLSPYKEGDGYEMTGVKMDKCGYTAVYGSVASIEISKYSQVCIRLQNTKNADLMDSERSNQLKKAF